MEPPKVIVSRVPKNHFSLRLIFVAFVVVSLCVPCLTLGLCVCTHKFTIALGTRVFTGVDKLTELTGV